MDPHAYPQQDHGEGRLTENTFRLASRRDWDAMGKDLRPVYTAINEADAKDRLDEFHDKWGDRCPAIRNLWTNAWSEFVPFLDYSPEIRRVIYSTDEIVNPAASGLGVASERPRPHRHAPRAQRGPSLHRVAA